MNGTVVVAGSASGDLATKLAGKLDLPLIETRLKIFPDGESKITLGSGPAAERALVVQGMQPPVDSNLIRSLLMVAKAKEVYHDVTAVVPYMGYARQDREFLPGEVVATEVVAELFRAAGASRLVTVDIHSKMALDRFKLPARSATAIPLLAEHFSGLDLKDPLAVSPDAGGSGRVEKFAGLCGCDHVSLEKRRDRVTGSINVLAPRPDIVAERDVILVDDMISTGGSMIKAAETLRGCGCGRVFAACTHALLLDGAAERLAEAGISGVVSSNTVPGPTCLIDVSAAVAAELMAG